MNSASLAELTDRVLRHRDERHWAQFHTPKELAISLCVESAELLSLMQWKNGPELSHAVNAKHEQIRDEPLHPQRRAVDQPHAAPPGDDLHRLPHELVRDQGQPRGGHRQRHQAAIEIFEFAGVDVDSTDCQPRVTAVEAIEVDKVV